MTNLESYKIYYFQPCYRPIFIPSDRYFQPHPFMGESLRASSKFPPSTFALHPLNLGYARPNSGTNIETDYGEAITLNPAYT